MLFRPRPRRCDGPPAGAGAPQGQQAFSALWELHREDLQRTAMAVVQDVEHAGEALEHARVDALRADPASLTRARLHRLVRDAAGDRVELFAATESPAELDARTALVLHEVGLRAEEITEVLAPTPTTAHEKLPAPEPTTVSHPQEAPELEPVLEPGPGPETLTVTFEPEAQPAAAPVRERRRRPVWQPLTGGGVAVAALAGALIFLLPGGGPPPVTNGATALGIGPALPPPAADGSGRPDTSSFGLLAASRENPRSPTSGAALDGALVADASKAAISSDGGSTGGGPPGGGNSPSGGGPSGRGDAPSGGGPSGGGPSGGGDAPSGGGGPSGGDAPSDRGPSGGGPSGGGGAPSGAGPAGGGGAPSGGGGAPSGGGPSGGGGAPSAGGGTAGGAAPRPPSSPSPAPAGPPGPVQQLVSETVGTVERVADSLLGGG